MPFQSEKQRRYLHANHPEIAKRWEKEYAYGGLLSLGNESIEEAQELASKEADIQKEIRRIERENRKRSSRKRSSNISKSSNNSSR